MTKFPQKSGFIKAMCLVFALFVSQISLYAQDSALNQQDNVSLSESQTPAAASSSSDSQNWNWSSGNYEQNQQAPSTLGLFVRMVFALLVVLALAYIAVRFLKRSSKLSDSNDPFLRHVSHLSLSTSRSVDVVTILDHAYILGVSDNAVNLIGQIDDKELVDSMNLYADKNDNKKRPRSFDDILSIFMPNSGRSAQSQNIYGSSAQNAADMLQRQRNRLNEEQ